MLTCPSQLSQESLVRRNRPSTSDSDALLLLRNVGLQGAHPGNEHLTYAQHETLRQRKTPKGRLCEPQDWSGYGLGSQEPAYKHRLVAATRSSPVLACDATYQRLQGAPESGIASHNDPNMRPYRSRVPVAMPTPQQTPYNPTASAGQAYYGPYWPDGTFSPYRPAPLSSTGSIHRDLSRARHLPAGRGLARLPPSDQCLAAWPVIHGTQGSSLPNRPAGQQFPSFGTRMAHIQGYTPLATSFPSSTHLPRSNVLKRDGLTVESATPKDSIFTQAYHAYVELLTIVQYVAVGGAPGSNNQALKPAFYPRPPQRKSYSTGSIPFLRKSESASRTTSSGHVRTEYRPHQSQSSPSSMNNYLPLPMPASSQPVRQMVYSRATMALGRIEEQCHLQPSLWIDGMLLAGCLAYGLRHYNKALDWYEKIIQHDPEHVEARSNMAATLLALSRKAEAMEHWTEVIKLRPSYFEAVEHLVGLLASSQRVTEAISIIEYVESSLQNPSFSAAMATLDLPSDDEETEFESRSPSVTLSFVSQIHDNKQPRTTSMSSAQDLVHDCAYLVAPPHVGRLLALIHGKGNLKYAQNDIRGAVLAFETVAVLATSTHKVGIEGLVRQILDCCVLDVDPYVASTLLNSVEPILLCPERAQGIVQRMFPNNGLLPGLAGLSNETVYKAAVTTVSSALLSLAKIYQDGLSRSSPGTSNTNRGARQILALYYLSMSLQPSPSTANNIGILLAGVQQTTTIQVMPQKSQDRIYNVTGTASGNGVQLAFAYYQYGLSLDGRHAHLYTNLGSLLKDLGQVALAIKMYETAVQCDGKFDIALANLANAVKDQGRVLEAIGYYRRAVQANRDFPEAVCGLATALNSICEWYGRGGVCLTRRKHDMVQVNEFGNIIEAQKSTGWLAHVVAIVRKQLHDGERWGIGCITDVFIETLCSQLTKTKADEESARLRKRLRDTLSSWKGQRWEGLRVVQLIERATRVIMWQWYQDKYKTGREYPEVRYTRPEVPAALTLPSVPTVLPFHAFTTPLTATQVRQISQRNALRISISTARAAWLSKTVYPPPSPPQPCLRVGYVSSDFNNHPLAHLMQSIFGIHDRSKVRAYCYATSASDNSIHRKQIETEAPVFHDTSLWSLERIIQQIVQDGIHILVNLNGYTRGAKNEIFAARPAPINMSFMGFASTMGAEWCDYVFADEISIPLSTLSRQRRNVTIEDKLTPAAQVEDEEHWVYAENVIFSRSTFFCVDHKQSAPDADSVPTTHCDVAWRNELKRRWQLRRELFPDLPADAVILGNFNQLYKIDPATYRLYLRILESVPNAYLWLLRFPEAGERHLMNFTHAWAGPNVASRVLFTDVASKGTHIMRASVVDLFLDTPECNAHTTAADTIWSGTPLLTWAKWDYKLCSRMASSIMAAALPEGKIGDQGRADLLVSSEQEYEEQAIRLASGLVYDSDVEFMGNGRGRLLELRRTLWEGRWTSRLFDTKRWVGEVEQAYWKAWTNWELGEGGDIWL